MGKTKRKAQWDLSEPTKHIKPTNLTDLSKHHYECSRRIKCASNAYVTQLAIGSDPSLSTAAVVLSTKCVALYNLETAQNLASFKGHHSKITDVRFGPRSNNSVLTSSLDGRICLWDLRSSHEKPSLEYSVKNSGQHCPITSFDLSELLICGGTEVINEMAYIMFWDVRSTKVLGAFWDSHVDEVTQVRLNEAQPHLLATSSLDNLINVFDLNQPDETEALLHTLNTDSSVYKLSWNIDWHDEEAKMVNCITEDDVFQYWDCHEAAPTLHFSKDEIGRLIKSDQVPSDYIADALKIKNTNLLATGNAKGSLALWTMESTPSIWTFLPSAHSDLVRAVVPLPTKKRFLTGSEDGTIAIWSKKKMV